MKLTHQINLAFGLAFIVVLSIIGLVIHYVLLDHFIGAEKNELRAISSAMAQKLDKYDLASGVGNLDPFQITTAAIAPLESGVEAFITDENGKIVQRMQPLLSRAASLRSEDGLEMSKVTTVAQGQNMNKEGIFANLGGQFKYITEVQALPQGNLTLVSPMNKIQEIEQALLKKMLIVLLAGGLAMFLLSLFITKRLIKPLMELRAELRKVKERRFSEVQLVKSGGELGTVAQTVHEMAGELNRFNQVQKHFFQNASHELKTPLMSISGYAEGIRDGVFEGEQVDKGLNIIMSESTRLKKLVTEMTLLAKLDSEENIFQRSEIRVHELLTEAIERINPLVVQKGLEVELNCRDEEQLVLYADRDKLLQALLNVAANATRYAVRKITIGVSLQRGQIEITVADDGPGISESLLPYLFHRFVKGKDGESGLGLAISRAIVERCGGSISAGNREEGGAELRLNFPVSLMHQGKSIKYGKLSKSVHL